MTPILAGIFQSERHTEETRRIRWASYVNNRFTLESLDKIRLIGSRLRKRISNIVSVSAFGGRMMGYSNFINPCHSKLIYYIFPKVHS